MNARSTFLFLLVAGGACAAVLVIAAAAPRRDATISESLGLEHFHAGRGEMLQPQLAEPAP